jgi:hypothetical protein
MNKMEKKIVGTLDMEKYQEKKCKWSAQKNPETIDPHIHVEK